MVATDFSPTAVAAREWGTEIAANGGWSVVLVHVLHLHGPLTDYMPSPPDVDEHLQALAVERLDEEAEAVATRGVEVTTRLELGLPSQTLVSTAEEIDPALLVMGTRGTTGLAHLLLGSTAERVVQHAPCPVLSVHPDDKDEHRPVRTVLVPTDFSHDAGIAAERARSLFSDGSLRVILLHAYHLPVEYTAYGTIPTGIPVGEDLGAVAEKKLAELAEELSAEGLEIRTESREGYPPEVIVDTARDRGADVIAMGTHGRSGLKHLLLGSNAERVVQHAPCPVLTVRHPESSG